MDGTGSTESAEKTLTYLWRQIYGPNVVQFNTTTSKPTISNLVEGIYKFRLTVTNADMRAADAEVLVIVSESGNIKPSVNIVSPSNNSTHIQGQNIEISASASDVDGQIINVDFYQNNILIASVNQAPYTTSWFPRTFGDYVLTAVATDNGDATSTSNPVSLTVQPVKSCSETLKEALQVSFSMGYKYTFETVGNRVNITFELLDDKIGVVAYLWKQTPFTELAMTKISDKVFTTTLNGLEIGSTITYACKFAFAGGMAVTKYISYQVGKDCSSTGIKKVINNELFFSPNPVRDWLYISLPPGISELSIYISGEKVLEQTISENQNINIKHLLSGLYIIRAHTDKEIYSGKILKQD